MCHSDAVRPVKTVWYLVAVVLIFGGWMAGVATAGTAWNIVREASLQPTRKPVDAANESVAVFTDVPQPDRDITCTARRGAKDTTPSTIPDATLDLTITRDGTVWTLIGLLRDGSPDLRVACTPKDKATDPASYSVGVVQGFVDRTRLGTGIGVLSVVVGFLLVGWTWWCRRSLREEAPVA